MNQKQIFLVVGGVFLVFVALMALIAHGANHGAAQTVGCFVVMLLGAVMAAGGSQP